MAEQTFLYFNAFKLFLKRVDPSQAIDLILQVVVAVMEEYKTNNPLPKPTGRWSHPTGRDAIRLEVTFRSFGRRTYRSKTLPMEGRRERRPKFARNAGKIPFLTCYQKEWNSHPKGLSQTFAVQNTKWHYTPNHASKYGTQANNIFQLKSCQSFQFYSCYSFCKIQN